jgi:ketosteroid isomerase-like protein
MLLVVGTCMSIFAGAFTYGADAGSDVRAQIVALEQRRCEAIATGDVKALSQLLSDDYVHIHGTGKVDTKAGFIQGIQQRPRKSNRGVLTVRVYGNIAILTGEQFNYMQASAGQEGTRTANYVTQVLRRAGDTWQYVSFQLTPLVTP